MYSDGEIQTKRRNIEGKRSIRWTADLRGKGKEVREAFKARKYNGGDEKALKNTYIRSKIVIKDSLRR